MAFGASEKDDTKSPFAFLGAGAPVFSSSVPKVSIIKGRFTVGNFIARKSLVGMILLLCV